MRSMDNPGANGVSLFVLAHQDDELCAAPIVASRKAKGRPVCVVYLTDGEAGGVSAQRRNRESGNALAMLGAAPSELVFLGSVRGFPDGKLHTVLPDALGSLEETVRAAGGVDEIFTLAYEGGHQDHDACHAAAVVLASRLGLLARTRQIPFYRKAGSVPGVAVLAPLAENGTATPWPLSAAERIRMLSLMRMYPSQWRVLLGLGPLLAAACAVRPGLPVQPVAMKRLRERPTAAPMFYERRQKVDAAEVTGAIARLAELA
jgi:LmbE family N-acetylglucosaminyl deacetylase